MKVRVIKPTYGHFTRFRHVAVASSGKTSSAKTRIHPDQLSSICKVITTAASVYTLMGGLSAAKAEERVWKPRRHHRRMDERIYDDWADEAVLAEEERMDNARSLKERMKERLRQQEEAEFKKMQSEQEARLLKADKILTQADASSRDLPFSLKVGGVETFPYIFWGSVAFVAAWGSRQLFDSVARKRAARGRWVYDRSLGGKKVWVEDAEGLTEGQTVIRDAEFDRLTSVASAARGSVKTSKPFSLPKWWNPPPTSFAAMSIKEGRQAEADRLLSRIEQAKNRGQDYDISDIVLLRSICQEGSVSVQPKTVGARDAIYKAAVEAAVSYAQGRTDYGLSLGEQDSSSPETRLLTGLALDLNLDEERAVSFVCAGVAASCRARLLEAVKCLKEDNEMEALVSLIKLSSLVQNLPALSSGDSEPDLIASSLQAASKVEERQKIFYILGQLDLERASLYAEMLGFDPTLVVPKLIQDLQAKS